jgi:hypothetical protein
MSNANNANNANNTNQQAEAKKEGFLKGFNWKHNAIAAVVAGAATAAGMYLISGKCECDMPDSE